MDTLLSERLNRLESSNRLLKVAMLVMAGLFVMAASVPQVLSFGPPIPHPGPIGGNAPLRASEFDLLGPGNVVTAKLTTQNGGPNLLFYDNSGNPIMSVGFTNTSTTVFAGMGIFDNNALLAGTGVGRFGTGIETKGRFVGEGLGTYDGSGNIRSGFGQAVDGSVAYSALYDETGTVRTGLTFYNGFEGFYSHDASGNTRTAIGQSLDGTDAFAALFDQNGSVRTGLDFNAGNNFEGFYTQEANGTPRSDIGTTTDGTYSFMNLLNQNGGPGVDGFVDNAGVQSNFATWNNSGIIVTLDGVKSTDGSGFVETFDPTGVTTTGHLP
jgi:hypothetical protein